MAVSIHPTAEAYVRNINAHDAAAFVALFAEDAIVKDAGREYQGAAAIKAWCEHDIVAPNVTMEILGSSDTAARTVVTTKVDGNFDRTGLPDPVIIAHEMTIKDGKIAALSCRLAEHP